MRTFLIFFLMFLLGVVAAFTKPTPEDYASFVDKGAAQRTARGSRYRDFVLWTSIQKDGKTLYVGAFDHWFAMPARVQGTRELALFER